MIALDRKVHEPEPKAVPSASEGSPYRSKHRRTPQRLDAAGDAQRDVNRMVTRKGGAGEVRHSRDCALRATARTFSSAAMGAKRELELRGLALARHGNLN